MVGVVFVWSIFAWLVFKLASKHGVRACVAVDWMVPTYLPLGYGVDDME